MDFCSSVKFEFAQNCVCSRLCAPKIVWHRLGGPEHYVYSSLGFWVWFAQNDALLKTVCTLKFEFFSNLLVLKIIKVP